MNEEGGGEAVWRAQEILQHFEGEEAEGQQLQPDLLERGTYLAMLRMWASSEESALVKARKVYDLFARMARHEYGLQNFGADDAKLVIEVIAQADEKDRPKLTANEMDALVEVLGSEVQQKVKDSGVESDADDEN